MLISSVIIGLPDFRYFLLLPLIILIAINIRLIKPFINFLNNIFYYLLTLFLIWTLLTSLWSLYPMVSLQRSFGFTLIILTLIITSFVWYHYNRNYFGSLLYINIIIVLISLFSVIFNYPNNVWSLNNVEGFHSIITHKNTFASVILFTLPGVVEKLFFQKNHYNVVTLFLVTLLLITDFSLLFLSNSRASFISSIIIMLPIVFVFSYSKYLSLIAIFFLLSFFSSFLLIPSFQHSVIKYFNRGTNLFASRSDLFNSSLSAAKEGGIIGIGFGISHPDIKNNANGSHFNEGRYIREKGNSILALIEEVGIIGLFLFFAPIVFVSIKLRKLCLMNPLKRSVDNVSTNKLLCNRHIFYYSVLPSILAFLLHSNFEAWMVGISSVQMILFLSFLFSSFLSISLISDKKKLSSTIC